MRALSRLAVLLLGAGLPAACSEPLGPRGFVGTYALQNVAGDALPALLLENDYVIVRVLADTLRFAAHGRGTGVQVLESGPPTGASPTSPVRWEYAFGFRVVEDRIEIAFDCPPGADCAAPPHVVARPIPGGLRADFALIYRVPQTYARVSSSP
jgi:hypothetical protein